MRVFSLRLTELAFRQAGLERPEDVVLVYNRRLAKVLAVVALTFLVWGATIYLSERGWSQLVHREVEQELLWTGALREVREFERYGKLGYAWRKLIWWPLQRRLG